MNLKPVAAWNLATPANGVAMYQDTIKPLKENIETVAEQLNKCVQVEPQNFTKAEKDQARKNLDADNGRVHRFCLYWSDIPYGENSTYCLLGDMEQLNEEGTDVLPVTKERLYEIYKNNEVLSFTSYTYNNREKHWGIASDVDIYFQDGHEGDFDYLSVSISFSLPVQFHSMRYPERYTCHNFTFGPNYEKSPYIAVYGPNASGHNASVGIYSMEIPDKTEVLPVFTSNIIGKGNIAYDEDTGEYSCRISNYSYNEITTPDSMTVDGQYVKEPTLVCYCDIPGSQQNILTFIDLKVNFSASWHAPIKLKIVKRYREWRSSQEETYTVELHSQYSGTFANGKTYTILVVGGSKSGGLGSDPDLPNGAWYCLDCSQERKVHNLLYGIQESSTTVPYLTDLDRFRTNSGDKKYQCYVTAEEVIKWHDAGDEIVLHYTANPSNSDNTFMLRSFADQSSGDSKACRLEFVSFLYGTVFQQINFITNSDGYLYVSTVGGSDFEQHKFAYTSGVISGIYDGVASVQSNLSFNTLTVPDTFGGDLTIAIAQNYQDAVNCDILITSYVDGCHVFVRINQGSVYDMLWTTEGNTLSANKKYLLSVRGNCCSLKEVAALPQSSENE